jgi:hypothetical protein
MNTGSRAPCFQLVPHMSCARHLDATCMYQCDGQSKNSSATVVPHSVRVFVSQANKMSGATEAYSAVCSDSCEQKELVAVWYFSAHCKVHSHKQVTRIAKTGFVQ